MEHLFSKPTTPKANKLLQERSNYLVSPMSDERRLQLGKGFNESMAWYSCDESEIFAKLVPDSK